MPHVPAYNASCPLAGIRPSGCRSGHGILLHSFQTHHSDRRDTTHFDPAHANTPRTAHAFRTHHYQHVHQLFRRHHPTTVATCIATCACVRPSHFTHPRLTQYGGVTDTSVTATRGSNGSWAEVTVGARSPTVTWPSAHSQEPLGPLHRAQRRAQCRQGTRRAKQGSTQHVRATLQPPNTTARPWIFFCGLSCIYVGGPNHQEDRRSRFRFLRSF